MNTRKSVALDHATVNDLALWLAQYIKREFEKYPQTRAPVMPYWEQMPTTQMAQSTWVVLIRDTPYAGWEYFDPPVQVTMGGHFLPIPARIVLGVYVFDKGLVVEGICQDNQALGFFADLMKAMEDAWPRATDSQDAPPSCWLGHRDGSRLEVLDYADNTEAIRDLLKAACIDEELMTLCFDHFRPVYDDFTNGMGRGEKVQRLLDYCVRQERVGDLLAAVCKANPTQYQRFAGQPTE